MEINDIQQYVWVNNLEIVGLPQLNENEEDETLILNALNNLEGIEHPIRHEKDLWYKYCWTRSGNINLRKTDNSQTIVISSDEDLVNLV